MWNMRKINGIPSRMDTFSQTVRISVFILLFAYFIIHNNSFIFYWFSNQICNCLRPPPEPGYYKDDAFGIRLANVLEVVDTTKRHPSGANFLALNDITLVPYDAKLIEPALLSSQEKRWLNAYNAKIREYVGEELKRHAGDMQAFYWMMNKTRHVTEYYTEADYRRYSSATAAGVASGGGLGWSVVLALAGAVWAL